MIANFFKTAWRNIRRQKLYTLINIIGLGSGISVCLIIFVLVQFHSSFDNFHPKKDHIYRILTEYHHSDTKDIFYSQGVTFGIPVVLHTDIPEIKQVVPIFHRDEEQIQVLNAAGQTVKKFKETSGVFITTPDFFGVFDFPLIAGNSTSLIAPNTALISQGTAEKYFGDSKTAIGKTLKWNSTDLLKVTGVLAPIPKNTDFNLKIVIAYGTGFTARLKNLKDYNGTTNNFGCYVLLPGNVSEARITQRLRAMVKKYHSPDNKDSEILQPLSEVHYAENVGDFSNIIIARQMIRLLWLIAGFILIIACVNFINLATAQSVNRSKAALTNPVKSLRSE